MSTSLTFGGIGLIVLIAFAVVGLIWHFASKK